MLSSCDIVTFVTQCESVRVTSILFIMPRDLGIINKSDDARGNIEYCAASEKSI